MSGAVIPAAQSTRRARSLRLTALLLTGAAFVVAVMGAVVLGCSERRGGAPAVFGAGFLLAEVPALLCLLCAARWPFWLKAAGYVAAMLGVAYLSVGYFLLKVCA